MAAAGSVHAVQLSAGGASDTDSRVGESAQRKAALRLLPVIGVGYGLAFMDRINISFAALQMNRDLHFSASVYGFGAGPNDSLSLLNPTNLQGEFVEVLTDTSGAFDFKNAAARVGGVGYVGRFPNVEREDLRLVRFHKCLDDLLRGDTAGIVLVHEDLVISLRALELVSELVDCFDGERHGLKGIDTRSAGEDDQISGEIRRAG